MNYKLFFQWLILVMIISEIFILSYFKHLSKHDPNEKSTVNLLNTSRVFSIMALVAYAICALFYFWGSDNPTQQLSSHRPSTLKTAIKTSISTSINLISSSKNTNVNRSIETIPFEIALGLGLFVLTFYSLFSPLVNSVLFLQIKNTEQKIKNRKFIIFQSWLNIVMLTFLLLNLSST